MNIFETRESNVRSYIRSFPAVFDQAEGACIYDEQGKAFIDFLSGAGALNYGHNHPQVTDALIKYLQRKGLIHSLDKATVAKRDFLKKFSETILFPRNLEYKVQFTGPTGTNSVEASFKLARLVKKRRNIIAFTNAFHGLSMGALEATGHYFYRNQLYSTRFGVDHMPFDGYLGKNVNTIEYLRKVFEDVGSGIDLPSAVIVETIQCEGGINVASKTWLQELQALCHEFDILLIVDDIQVGNGRTGQFFSFEEAGLVPDIICLSKSIGGGLPMSLLLMAPEIDKWQPGEHTGTFRGNNLAFIAATEILGEYWETDNLSLSIQQKGQIMQETLQQLASSHSKSDMKVRGRGMIWGLEIPEFSFASKVSAKAFEKQLIIETCGSKNQVLKLLPPLIIEEDLLHEGLQRLIEAVNEVAAL